MPQLPAAVPQWAPLEPLDQDDLLGLFDRILPAFYLDPLKSPGPGYEYLQAVAKMVARVSEAIAHIGTGCYIGSGTGGTYATSTVEFYRDNTVYGAVTLRKGTVVGTAEGYLYQTTADVSFGALDLGPHSVSVQAMARGWNWNKDGPVVAKSGEVLPGAISRLVTPIVSGSNFDPTLQVRQISDATGGSSQMLDGVGQDRGIYRTVVPATVYLTRTNTWPVIILAGSRLKTADGYVYRTAEPILFARNDTAKKLVHAVPLIQATQAEIAGHGLIAAGTAGLDLIRWGGTTPDPSLEVEAGTQTAYYKESDESYRARIAILPETVTPASIRRLLVQILGPVLQPLSADWALREVWDIRYQTAYSETYTGTSALDFPINTTFTTAEINVVVPEYSSNIFVYDYTAANGNDDPLSNRYLSEQDRGQVVIAVPDIGTQNSAIYPGMAANLEQAKPAGIDIAYILVP